MAENAFNPDRDWSFEIDLTGVNAPTGQQDILIPEGYYTAVVTDAYINKEKSANRVIFKLTISDGPFTGTIRTTGLGIPSGPDDKVRYYWRGLAESAGYTSEQLDNGAVKFGVNVFKGRETHIRYTPPATEGGFDSVSFLAPGEWANQKRAFDSMPTSMKIEATEKVVEKTVVPEKKVNPLESAPTTASKADLLSRLGGRAANA